MKKLLIVLLLCFACVATKSSYPGNQHARIESLFYTSSQTSKRILIEHGAINVLGDTLFCSMIGYPTMDNQGNMRIFKWYHAFFIHFRMKEKIDGKIINFYFSEGFKFAFTEGKVYCHFGEGEEVVFQRVLVK